MTGPRVDMDTLDYTDQLECVLDGRPFTGVAVEYGRNGVIITESSFRNGFKDGVTRLYYGNGQQESEEWYRYGVSRDTARFWSPEGVLTAERDYGEQGLVIASRVLRPDGTLADDPTFVPHEPWRRTT